LQLLSHVVLSVAFAGVTVTLLLPARPPLVPSPWLSSRGSALALTERHEEAEAETTGCGRL